MQQARGISGCREFVKNDEEELTTPAPSLRTGIKKPRNHGTFRQGVQAVACNRMHINQANAPFIVTKTLTQAGLYGLMRPVARIAQSVEQGIENPRVLGSIPSPGTTSSEPVR